MGDLHLCSLHLKSINGEMAGPPGRHPPSSNPPAILPGMWRHAERATQEIINQIQPTVESERRRKAVVEYVQKLIRGFVSTEVFPFGSVPLKTYLPDGDIDLTAIGMPNSEDALASDVRSILEGEEHNNDSEFEVKDVQYIQAEVKLVKCLVQNVVVDISFNQIGGLCTLCFLEKVDRFIGKEHLFKRSIMLIKAWCYYESRILGAHHGLISTYALETLVLYIFHLFHSSLDGPLAVLYRFLDYYCKFDWDKYCISLHGPVSLSSLPELAVEAIDNDGGDLLLTEEFLRSCIDSFSVPVRGSESNSRTFIKKHLNIVDPLRESNNLGRSVSKGNFYRIRSAFTYGARKLERILRLSSGSIAEEVYLFFMNTLDRHGGGERPDVQDLVPKFLGSQSVESNGAGIDRDLDKKMKNIRISALDEIEDRTAPQKSPPHKHQNSIKIEPSGEVNGISSGRLIGDAKDLATETSRASTSSKEDGDMDLRKAYRAPHLVFHPEHQNRNVANLDQIRSTSVLSTSDLSPYGEFSSSKHADSRETASSSDSPHTLGDFSNNNHLSRHLYGVEGSGVNGPSSLPAKMPDLSGDYDMHLTGLNYALWCQEQILSTYFVPVHRPPQYSYYHRGRDVWSRGSMFAPVNANALSPQPPFSPAARYSSMSQPFISGSFNADDAPKTRGTGTYFPNTNYHVNRERHSPGRARIAVPAYHMPRPQNNGQADIPHDMSSEEKGFHELGVNSQPVFRGSGRGRLPARLDIPQWASRPTFKPLPPTANGILVSPEFSGLEFGSLGPVSAETPTKEHERRLDSSISHSQQVCSPASNSRKSSLNSNKERALQSYQLKDEEDFPPLSG